MIIFLDLDGPIIDVSEKYYRVYVDILSRHNVPVLSKEEYWQAKREKTPDEVILKNTGFFCVESYRKERKDLIESDRYLLYDRLQDGALDVLNTLCRKHELVLVTLRSHPDQLKKELQYLHLDKYFAAVLTSPTETSPRWGVKVSLIKKYLDGKMITGGVMIGDTETDILAGNSLGCRTIGVLNGIRSRRLFKEAQPTYLVETIRHVLNLTL